MSKETITNLVVKYDEDIRTWLLDAYFSNDAIEEIYAWYREREIPPMPKLSRDLVGLTLQEAQQVLVEKYGAAPFPTRVSFTDGMAYFEDGESFEATPDMLRAMPEMINALRASVRTLHQYRFMMEEYWPTTTYPAGIDAEDGGRNLLNRLCPGLDMWGLPLPKEEEREKATS